MTKAGTDGGGRNLATPLLGASADSQDGEPDTQKVREECERASDAATAPRQAHVLRRCCRGFEEEQAEEGDGRGRESTQYRGS